MIQSFGDTATEALYHGRASARTRRCPADLIVVAVRKLDLIDAAADIQDLRAPPGNRLEKLAGKMKGLHSIRVNDQRRIVFRWTQDGPADVSVVDYH